MVLLLTMNQAKQGLDWNSTRENTFVYPAEQVIYNTNRML